MIILYARKNVNPFAKNRQRIFYPLNPMRPLYDTARFSVPLCKGSSRDSGWGIVHVQNANIPSKSSGHIEPFSNSFLGQSRTPVLIRREQAPALRQHRTIHSESKPPPYKKQESGYNPLSSFFYFCENSISLLHVNFYSNSAINASLPPTNK